MLRYLDVVSSRLESSSNNVVISLRDAGFASDEDSFFVESEIYGSIGLTSRPYGPDANGAAKALVDSENNNAVIALSDFRVGGMYGNLSPGDTALHCSHPNQSAQLLLKGESRQAATVVTKENQETMIFSMSGKDETVLFEANGAKICIDPSGNLIFKASGGATLELSDVANIIASSIGIGSNPKTPLSNKITGILKYPLTGTCPSGAVTIPAGQPFELVMTPSNLSVD